MAFFCKGRRERYVSPFDELAKHESAKLAEHHAKFNRLYKRNPFHGHDALIVPLAEGDEQATARLWILLRTNVDPTSRRHVLPGIEWLEALDLIGVYGKNIVAFHDVLCSGDVARTTACLKAFCLSWLSADEILRAVTDPSQASFSPAEVLKRVTKVIPGFGVDRNK